MKRSDSGIWNLGIEAPKIWNQGIEAQKSGIWDMATPDSPPSSVGCCSEVVYHLVHVEG